jgi:hypothetical protein
LGAESADIEKPLWELETEGDGSDDGGGDVAVDVILDLDMASNEGAPVCEVGQYRRG